MRYWSLLVLLCLLSLVYVLPACLKNEPAATPLPPLIMELPPPSAYASLSKLGQAAVPIRDLADLAHRFKGVEPASPPLLSIDDQPGHITTFWYKNKEKDTNQKATAKLVVQTATLNLWVDESVSYDLDTVQSAAARLEKEVIPKTLAFFGSASNPGGVDGPRLNLLHLASIGGGVVGYFSAADSFSMAVAPFSNERPLLYISLDRAPIGDERYFELIAHEYQHLLQWQNDPNETTWLNEGLAELSVQLNGFEGRVAQGYKQGLLASPDTQLTHFEYTAADYGAAYLFSAYFLQRMGAAATQTLARHPDNGRQSVAAVLASAGIAFDDFFADWAVANYLASQGLEQGKYAYPAVSLAQPVAATTAKIGASQTAAVHQYGVDYVEITAAQPVTLIFTGTRQVKLMDTSPHSGAFFWTSVPADAADMRLTRSFDLSAVQTPTATLTFWTWYDIELGWDYGYVAASADGGRSWATLQTIATNGANPQGNNLGVGFTGTSGSLEPPVWQQQTADLTPYIGMADLLIRFEYITDDAVYGQGMALDDIAIPALGYTDDAEASDGSWAAEGFVRHTNILPQTFLLQLILLHADGSATVERLPLDEAQRGRWPLPLGEEITKAVLVIAGNTAVTAQPAAYAYKVTSP